MMEPKIVDSDPIILVGFSFFGDPFALSGGWTEENEIGRLWNRFVTFVDDHGDQIKHVKDRDVNYEVHVEHPETPAKGNVEVFVGVEVDKLEDVPVQMLVKILPPTKYAVFTLEGEQITSDWARMIYHEWMPQSGYQEAHRYLVQYYDPRFKGVHKVEESVLDIYIPIQ